MNKKLIFFFLSFIIFGCSSPDNSNSLPSVDTLKYLNGNGFYFKSGTCALDIFSTLYSKYGEGEHLLNADSKIITIQTAQFFGVPRTEKKEEILKAIYLEKSHNNVSNKFIVKFIKQDNSELLYYYEWQYYNNNVWHNDIIKSDIYIN